MVAKWARSASSDWVEEEQEPSDMGKTRENETRLWIRPSEFQTRDSSFPAFSKAAPPRPCASWDSRGPMHIKRIVIEGFKVYRDRVEPEPFSPKHNIVVGANGAGKSNFFAAVQFVLGDLQKGNLRAEERKALLHEGAGQHVMSAYVEIYLDNTDQRLPLDKQEVVIKRTIGLKKDEYFLERKHVTKTEILNLLESAGFSRSNPYNIVPQGKVNLLTTMRDEQRLELLKEVAGTRTYVERRQESLAILSDSAAKREKIADMIDSIESRLKDLDEEKQELAKYQSLDKRRRVAEYMYYDRELRRARDALQKLDAQRDEESGRSATGHELEEAAKQAVIDADAALASASLALSLSAAECRSRSEEHRALVAQTARLEADVRAASDDSAARAVRQQELTDELAAVKRQASEVQGEMEKIAPKVTSTSKEAELIRAEERLATAQLQSLYARGEGQFSTKKERDQHLKSQAAIARSAADKAEADAKELEARLEAHRSESSEQDAVLAASRERLSQERQKRDVATARCTALKRERDALTDNRKVLWRKEHALRETRRASQEQLERTNRTLQQSMSRALWEATSAVRSIAADKGVKGVLGMLCELFSVDEKFFTAVEVAAGNQLFHVVVDTDETAATMLRHLQEVGAGRVTFVPLNRLRPGPDVQYPESEDAIPMLKKLKPKDERVRPALKQVFRKILVVRNLEVGARFSKSNDLDCITLEGDTVSRKGAVSGGYVDVRKSRLRALAECRELSTACERADEEATALTGELERIDADVTRVMDEIRSAEDDAQRAASAAEREQLEVSLTAGAEDGTRSAMLSKEKALAALRSTAEAERSRVQALEAEISSGFSKQLTGEDISARDELVAGQRDLAQRRVAAERAAARAQARLQTLEDELRENIRKRQEELEMSIEQLAAEGAAGSVIGTSASSDALTEELNAARTRLAASAEALSEAQSTRDAKLEEERTMKTQLEEMKAKIAFERNRRLEGEKELDRLLTRKSALQQKADEFTDCIRKLGALPRESFDESYRSMSSKQLMVEIEKCHKELSKLGHVNKKALDQFANFNEQRDKLFDRQAEIDESEKAIKELIEHLDRKKDEAMERTFKGVAKHFADVFRELVPGGTGKLVMKTNQDVSKAAVSDSASARLATYQGVSIRAQFAGGSETFTMQQLSGGQKTMVALCLIFAIQRCDPAPFYIFDEIDANLDAAHRASLAQMIERQAAEIDAEGGDRPPTQFITTTFRPELIHTGDKFYGVTHRNKASSVRTIDQAEALRIIAEDQSRTRQHALAIM